MYADGLTKGAVSRAAMSAGAISSGIAVWAMHWAVAKSSSKASSSSMVTGKLEFIPLGI